jgi:ribosomal protein S18 acetylase RimI-like enzyme
MTASLEISPCPPADREWLFQLAHVAFAHHPGWESRVLHALVHDRVFIARDDRPAGYVAVRGDGGTGAVVDQLLVAVGHEGMGVGRLLLAHAEEYAIDQHAEVVRIVVERDNPAARSFYVRAGFVPVGPEVIELDLRQSVPRLT